MLKPKLGNLTITNRVGQHRVYGLIGFNSQFPNRASDTLPRIRISVGKFSRDFEIDELRDSRPDGVRDVLVFSVLTHLIPNGTANVIVQNAADERILANYEIVVDNQGQLAADVTRSLNQARVNAIFGATIDSGMFPYGDQAAQAWFDQAPPPNVPLSFDPQSSEEDAMAHLHAHGFCLLPATVPGSLCDDLNACFDQEVAAGRVKYLWGTSQRIHNMHKFPPGRAIWTYGPVIGFLRQWFRDEPVACQTLYYAYGSQQHAHQDTIHLTPYPAGYMCGVWIALEDVAPESGELFVYAGSHLSPRLRASQLGLAKVFADYSGYDKFDDEVMRLMDTRGFAASPYRPRKGQILVWHENLVHGGAPRLNLGLQRRSVVSHYFARGAVGYYDSRGEPAVMEEMPAPAQLVG